MPETPSSRSASDETLARQAQHGCVDSFAELVARYQVPLMRFMQRRTPTIEDAEDLTQEAFVRAHANLERYRSNWRFGTWLFTLARRLSINHHNRRQLGHQPLVDPLDSSNDPARVFADRERAKQLWDRAAVALTESQWSSLWLYYVQDLSTVEISHVLSCTPAAVKALLHRGRRKLAAELTKPGPQPKEGAPETWIETLSAAYQQSELDHEE
jgi:RNA polymerase sigma-70 factor (ECF subfamily)